MQSSKLGEHASATTQSTCAVPKDRSRTTALRGQLRDISRRPRRIVTPVHRRFAAVRRHQRYDDDAPGISAIPDKLRGAGPARHPRSSHAPLLTVIWTRTDIARHTFSVAAPSVSGTRCLTIFDHIHVLQLTPLNGIQKFIYSTYLSLAAPSAYVSSV